MEIPLVFEPLKNPLFGAVSISVFIMITGALGIVFFTKNRSVHRLYRQLFSLLCFFAFIISMGSAMFTWFFGERIGTVTIHENRFETPYGDFEFEDIKNIVIKKDLATNSILAPKLSGNYVSKILMLTETGERFTFSEGNYPVVKMISPMRKAWEEKKKDD